MEEFSYRWYNLTDMAKINDYFKRKYEAEKNESEDYKKKLMRHRMRIFYKIAIGVAVLIALVLLIYFNRKNAVYSDYETINQISYDESLSSSYLNLNGNVLRYSKDGASAFNMQEDMLWNQTYEMQNPMIDVCGDYAAIGDYKGTCIYVFNSNGLQGKVETTLPVQNFCVSNTGNVAMVVEEEEITWVKLFNKNGELIANDRTTMVKSGYPVRVAISDNGILLGISYIRVDAGVLSSSVAFYNFGAVGQNEIDNLVSGYDYPESVISEVAFMSDSSSFAVGDDRLIIFSGDQKPEKVAEVPIEDEINSVFYGTDYVGLVFTDPTSEYTYRLEVYDKTGALDQTYRFDLDYNDVIFNKDQVVVYNTDECIIFNRNGDEKFHSSFHHSIITLIPTAVSSKYQLVTGTSMEEIQLQ